MLSKYDVWDKKLVKKYLANQGTPITPKMKRVDRMLFGSKLIEGNSLLDVGCGQGHLYPFVRCIVDKYTGFDQSEEMASIAKYYFPEIRLIIGDLYSDLKVVEKHDTIIGIALLQHLPDVKGAVERMWGKCNKALVASFQYDKNPRREIKTVRGKSLINSKFNFKLIRRIARDIQIPEPDFYHCKGRTWFFKMRKDE